MTTLENYVRENGYKVSDLTAEQIEVVKKEVEMINRGEQFLDGFFSNFIPLGMRKGAE